MTFFKEYKVSERNQEIVSDYIADFRDVGRGLSEITVQNNIRIMMFVLKSISTDLDKLTRADVKQYKRSLDIYKRKDGKPVKPPVYALASYKGKTVRVIKFNIDAIYRILSLVWHPSV